MSAWTDAGFPDRLPLQSFRAVTETLIAACRERNYNNNFSVAAAISWVEYSIEQMDTNKRLLMDSIDDMLAAVSSLYVAWDGADISQPASLSEFCAAFGIAYVSANRLSTVFSRAWILCRYRLLNCLRYIRTTQVATGYRRKEMIVEMIVPQSGSISEREYSGSTGNVPMCQNSTYDGNPGRRRAAVFRAGPGQYDRSGNHSRRLLYAVVGISPQCDAECADVQLWTSRDVWNVRNH